MKRIMMAAAAVVLTVATMAGQKIFMLGDSHIALKTYPQELEKILAEEVPTVQFESLGIGGAGLYTYLDKPAKMELGLQAAPDIFVIAVGTNDCNNWYYSPSKMRERVTRLYTRIKERLPECKVVLVTPFMFKTKVVRGTGLELNPNVEATVEVYRQFSDEHDDVWCIDLNTEHGMDFLDRRLMRKDFIHLTNDGYCYLARLVADGLETLPGLLNVTPQPIDPE